MPSDRKYLTLTSSLCAILQPKSCGSKAITFPMSSCFTPPFVSRNITTGRIFLYKL
uniref:Uncharacterized protein n=1 Tax=Zea mays TaxID=4577 RepID=C4IZM3_MAIZE|nr:unknown [Zea mays]